MSPRGPLPPLSARARLFRAPDMRDTPIEVIHEAQEWVVISKPSGLLSVPGVSEGADDAVSVRIQRLFPHASGGLVVHRLDMSTSGLMVFALTPEALVKLNRSFARREVKKRYTALLKGVLSGTGTLSLPLRLDPFQRPLQLVDPLHGKESLTRWATIDQVGECTLVDLYPITGRTHQLRIHAAHPLGLNAPIVGDPLYARETLAGGGHVQDQRLHLHATALSFADPTSGAEVSFTQEAPFNHLKAHPPD
jgi:tRNA pseudouridine32 synthase / 23S rRNA pseudouridine746 synthase